MRLRHAIVFVLAALLIPTGCSDDDTPAGPTNNTSADAGDTDQADTSQPEDSGTDSSSPDGGDQECQVDSDCDGPQQTGFCDADAHTCSYTCDPGFDDCDNDRANGCEADLTTIDNCGGCGNACESDDHVAPICSSSGCATNPDACAEGFVDLNEDDNDGCECEITDPDDAPDAAGEDTNCDGFDGIVAGEDANVVFVDAAGGSDADNDGLAPQNPVATIAAGISAADDDGRGFVLVAGGEYAEHVDVANGIGIYGGYDAENGWVRDTDNQTTTIAPTIGDTGAGQLSPQQANYETVSAEDIDQPTILDGLTIEGVDATASSTGGASSYAVWTKNADSLTIQNTQIQAGSGAAGAPGADGQPGADRLDDGSCAAPAGGDGATADSDEKPCSSSGYDGQHANIGADGDLADASDDLGIGGQGGIHRCNDSNGSESPTDGDDGTQGVTGEDGDNGQPLADGAGTFDDGHWMLAAGIQPTEPTNGGGGGGGGAGGNYEATPVFLVGCQSNNTCFAAGGNGGAGGAGGCAAGGTQNGHAGGGSFGVAIAAGTVAIDDTTIVLATAGNGGKGGDGAQGAIGNDGASGSNHSSARGGDSGDGGDGGDGGAGGDVGAGAGGCGGATFGVIVAADATFEQDDTVTIDDADASPAAPGVGGEAVDGSSAPAGCDGVVAKVQTYSAP